MKSSGNWHIEIEIEIKIKNSDGFLISRSIKTISDQSKRIVATLIIVKLPFTVYIACIFYGLDLILARHARNSSQQPTQFFVDGSQKLWHSIGADRADKLKSSRRLPKHHNHNLCGCFCIYFCPRVFCQMPRKDCQKKKPIEEGMPSSEIPLKE